MDVDTHRARDLEEARARYRWDHDTMPPFGLLSTGVTDPGGILDMASILEGFTRGLPAQERADAEWVADKAAKGVGKKKGRTRKKK